MHWTLPLENIAEKLLTLTNEMFAVIHLDTQSTPFEYVVYRTHALMKIV